jgi:hypothetical protein
VRDPDGGGGDEDDEDYEREVFVLPLLDPGAGGTFPLERDAQRTQPLAGSDAQRLRPPARVDAQQTRPTSVSDTQRLERSRLSDSQRADPATNIDPQQEVPLQRTVDPQRTLSPGRLRSIHRNRQRTMVAGAIGAMVIIVAIVLIVSAHDDDAPRLSSAGSSTELVALTASPVSIAPVSIAPVSIATGPTDAPTTFTPTTAVSQTSTPATTEQATTVVPTTTVGAANSYDILLRQLSGGELIGGDNHVVWSFTGPCDGFGSCEIEDTTPGTKPGTGFNEVLVPVGAGTYLVKGISNTCDVVGDGTVHITFSAETVSGAVDMEAPPNACGNYTPPATTLTFSGTLIG